MSKIKSTLTKEEELILFRAIKVSGTYDATPKEKLEAKKAKKTLVDFNQLLIHSIVNHYPHSTDLTRYLIKAGNDGLLKALENYDLEKPYKFSTYATWWIREEIHKALGLSK